MTKHRGKRFKSRGINVFPSKNRSLRILFDVFKISKECSKHSGIAVAVNDTSELRGGCGGCSDWYPLYCCRLDTDVATDVTRYYRLVAAVCLVMEAAIV